MEYRAQQTSPMRTEAAGVSGSVRVRPTGDRSPSLSKRYQYEVPGRSPSTSTTTVQSVSAPVRSSPVATTSVRPGSAASHHRAEVAPVSLVQSRTPEAVGSNEATAWRNTGGTALGCHRHPAG